MEKRRRNSAVPVSASTRVSTMDNFTFVGSWKGSRLSDKQWLAEEEKSFRQIFEKAGWPEFQKKEFPFLVDTTIFVKHIDRESGTIYPISLPKEFLAGKIQVREQ